MGMLTKRPQRPIYPRPQTRPPTIFLPGVAALENEVRKFQEIIHPRKNLDVLLGGGYTELRTQRTEAIRCGNVVLQQGIVTRMSDLARLRIRELKSEENELHGLRTKIRRIGDRGLEEKVVRLVQKNMRQTTLISGELVAVEAILTDLRPRVESELHRDDY